MDASQEFACVTGNVETPASRASGRMTTHCRHFRPHRGGLRAFAPKVYLRVSAHPRTCYLRNRMNVRCDGGDNGAMISSPLMWRGRPVRQQGVNRKIPASEVVMTASTTLDNVSAFRSTMGRLASGVSVITTHSGEVPIGITASAVTALSMDPLQLLVCVANHLYTREAISRHGRFGVNVLGQDSEALARQFSSSKDRFAGVGYDVQDGVPLLHDAIAQVVCAVSGEHQSGDHTIFIGDAQRFEHRVDCRPLVHFRGEFSRIV